MKKIFFAIALIIILFGKNVVFADVSTVHLYDVANDTIYSAFYYDTTLDDDNSWRTNSSKDWYQEPSDPSDDFYGTSLDTNRWHLYLNGGSIDYNFNASFNTNGVRTGTPCAIYSGDKWEVSGTSFAIFDIQIDFDNFTGTGTDGGIAFYAYFDEQNFVYVRRHVGPTNRYDTDVFVSGNSMHYQYVNTTDTSGKLRLSRYVSNVYAYYWDAENSEWHLIGSVYNGFPTTSVKVAIEVDVTNASCSVDMDNFIINEGTTNFGQHGSASRSSVRTFPEKAILVCHESGLDIFNAADQSMWMRFDKTGSVNSDALHQNMVADRVEKVYAKNGKIYLTAHSGRMNGLGIIDFTSDSALFHDMVPRAGWDYTSSIARRNFANDIIGWEETSHAQLINLGVNDLSVKEIGGTNYIAVATDGGVTVINENLDTKNNYAGSVANAICIGEDGALYFNSGGNFCQDLTSWRPGSSDGTFLSDVYTPVSNVQTLATTTDYVFIGTSGGISKRSVNDITTEISNYNTSGGLLGRTSDNVKDIEIANETLWAGSGGSGGCVSVISISKDWLKGYFSTDSGHGALASNDIYSMSYCENNHDLVIASNGGIDLLSGGTGEISHPDNLEIEEIGDTIYLEWGNIPEASSYKIYSSEDANAELSDWHLEAETTSTSWNEPASDVKKFYYVCSED